MRQWTFHSLRGTTSRTEALQLGWEVLGDPISDSYTPDEITASDLFDLWSKKYGSENNGLLSIYWFVEPVGEAAPYQSEKTWLDEDFLSFWSNPIDVTTGEPMNWLTLSVFEKGWNHSRSDKGGFIQEATGWKPSPLQPYVTLASLQPSRRIAAVY